MVAAYHSGVLQAILPLFLNSKLKVYHINAILKTRSSPTTFDPYWSFISTLRGIPKGYQNPREFSIFSYTDLNGTASYARYMGAEHPAIVGAG
jgi:hypothetical protein